jgi:signal transduction histidine kinase
MRSVINRATALSVLRLAERGRRLLERRLLPVLGLCAEREVRRLTAALCDLERQLHEARHQLQIQQAEREAVVIELDESRMALAMEQAARREAVVQLDETRVALAMEQSAHRATLDQLHHTNRLATVGKLAAAVIHDLGTPLNVISGRAQMIELGEAEGDEAVDNARIIDEQAQRMAALIRQLLSFARQRDERVPVDLRALTEQTMNMLLPLARKARIQPQVDEHSLGEAVVVGVPGKLQQVLVNLVTNAFQAMPEGGFLTVALTEEQLPPRDEPDGPPRAWYCIAVTDQGVGIPDDDHLVVFEAFYTTKTPDQGTGLGLSVSAQIVMDHGGWIGLESEAGQGSCFRVYLPRKEMG